MGSEATNQYPKSVYINIITYKEIRFLNKLSKNLFSNEVFLYVTQKRESLVTQEQKLFFCCCNDGVFWLDEIAKAKLMIVKMLLLIDQT